MKNEDDEIREPEIVEEEAVDLLRRPNVPTTVEEIAALGLDQAREIIEARDKIITALRNASIKQTRPSDWVLNKDRFGKVRAYLEDGGAQRLMPLWGIVVRNVTQPQRQNAEDQSGEFAYTVIGDGYCSLTRQTVESVEGTRYSTERYATEKPAGIQREVAVKKAARANLEGRIVRNLAGLNNVPLDDLITITGDKDFEKKATLGHGYGTSSERQGQAGDDHGVAPADIPTCDACAALPKPVATKMVFKKELGKAKKPGWYCPNYKAHEKVFSGIDHADLLARLEVEKASKAKAREPGDEPE